MSTEKTFTADVVSLLIASSKKANPALTIDYVTMSKLSNFTTTPTTKSAFEHQFRAIKKRANELLAEAEKREAAGETLAEVAVAADKKRGESFFVCASILTKVIICYPIMGNVLDRLFFDSARTDLNLTGADTSNTSTPQQTPTKKARTKAVTPAKKSVVKDEDDIEEDV